MPGPYMMGSVFAMRDATTYGGLCNSYAVRVRG